MGIALLGPPCFCVRAPWSGTGAKIDKKSFPRGEGKGAYMKNQKGFASIAKRLAFAAVFAALCCVATVVIVVPLPYGYFNLGDVFVLLAGWCLGPLYGAAAAAIGSGLADILSGYTLYAPVTFAVKGVSAAGAYFLWRILKHVIVQDKADTLVRLTASLVAEAWMVFGYFVFESVLYGGAGGAASLVGNALQGAFCIVCALFLVSVFYRLKPVKRIFPMLGFTKAANGA